jgi:TrkA-C domain
MTGPYLVLPTLIVIFASLLIVRAAGIALRMTGLDKDTANFQALSAFTRTGFTTKEAELVMNHPQRRRIVAWLIILGNAGLIAVIVSATSSLSRGTGYELLISIGALVVGVYLIYLLGRHVGFAERWERFIENRIARSRISRTTSIKRLLHLAGGYGIVEVFVGQDSPLIGGSIEEKELLQKELVILGIERGQNWIDRPSAKDTIEVGDRLIIYGQLNTLESMFSPI